MQKTQNNDIGCCWLWCKWCNIPVLRIRDILRQRRDPGIPTVDCGSGSGSGPGSCSFRRWLSRNQETNNFFPMFFLLITTYGGTVQSSKIPIRSHVNVKILKLRFFLIFFPCWWKDPDPHKYSWSGSRRPINLRILWLRIHNTET
jgi:hypothetical protein